MTADEQRRLLEDTGFRIDIRDDPTEEMVEELRAVVAGPPEGGEPRPLTTALIVDDMPRKMVGYFRTIGQGRTARLLAVGTAA